MLPVHAHEAFLELGSDADADAAAPGASVTVALCGHWQREGASSPLRDEEPLAAELSRRGAGA